MPPSASTTPRRVSVLAACLLALGLSAHGASPAGATSQDLRYSCLYAFAGAQGTVEAVSRFDSSIEEDGPLETGVPVDNQQWSGSVTFPTELTTALADAGIDSLRGDGLLDLFLDGHKAESDVELTLRGEVPDEPLPTVLQVVGLFGLEDSGAPGTHALQAGDFTADLEDDGATRETLHCTLVDEGDATVDSYVVAAATATPSPSGTPLQTSPVRPALVQTDVAQDSSTPWVWRLTAGALLLVAVGTVVLRSGGRRLTGRR